MKINNLMKEKGLTAKALSELSGVNRRAIDEYMQGRRNIANAQLHIALALATALGVHPSELLEPPK